ncbi:MAG: hypothetical protein Q8O52_08300 [Sulfuritalea sp.]|nr:hypothetical protein [Sulfuritalea sp.]
MKHREEIESRLFARIETVFALAASVTLYDLTNTYFEGAAAANPKAARGEKRPDRIQERIGRLKAASRGAGQHYTVTPEIDATGTTVTALRWEKTPVPGTMLTDPGVYCLRSNELTWNAEQLWRTYMMLTDLEAVFRSLKGELGLRPIFHSKEERSDGALRARDSASRAGNLFISMLAYQFVQAIRQRLRAHDIHESWTLLRAVFSIQRRVTASFVQKDGRTLHVRKATRPEPDLLRLYDALGLAHQPGGVQKLTA